MDDVVDLHMLLKGMTKQEAGLAFLKLCMQWKYYGSTIFPVEQTYKWDWPKVCQIILVLN